MMKHTYPQVERVKDTFEVTINFSDHIVSKNEIIRSIGYSEGKVPAPFEEMINDTILQLAKRCEIKAGYRLLDIKKAVGRSDGLYVNNIFFKMKKIVTSQLQKAEKAALFVCTIGSAMEDWAKQLIRDGNPTLGYIVDTTASMTVENVTDLLHDYIEQQMLAKGLKITNRYSPGYCNWSVSEQHLLFSLLPANFCGITLTKSALMMPIKSISGIIGVGTAVKRLAYMCDTCGIKDCTYRSVRSAHTEHIY